MIRKEYLRSKIRPPHVRHTLLPINNIAELIDGVPLDETVFLVAPYSYGKTLAVLSWLHERRHCAAWLTLDAEDNNETVFMADISASIMRLCGFEGDTDDVLADPAFSENRQTYLWDAVAAVEDAYVHRVLVIDNFGFMRNEPTLLALFKDIIFGLLGRWRIIVISRTEPPSVFNDMMLKRKIYLITIRELAFTHEEIEQFFTLNGCPISQEEVLKISEQTEGWPAAMNVLLTLSRGGPVVYSDAVHDYITEFFETEIWRDLNTPVKDFLLKTSVLDTLTPALCNAVTNIGATLPTLRWLYVNGMFISRLDQNDAYRYHNVFKSFLSEKLAGSEIDARKLYRNVGWSLLEKGELEQAFPYFFKAQDMDGLSSLFRALNPAELGIGRYLKMASCITELNADDLKKYPIIMARMVLINFFLGNMEEMQRLYCIFTEWLKPGALSLTPDEYAECICEAGWFSYLNPAETLENNMNYRTYLHSIDDPYLAEINNRRRMFFCVPSVLSGARDLCHVLKSDANGNRNDEDGYVYSVMGFTKADTILQSSILRAESAYQADNLDLSSRIIHRVLDEDDTLKATDLYMSCIALLIKIAVARGSGGTDAMLKRLENLIVKNKHTFLMPTFRALELKTKLINGFSGQTEEFKSENMDYMDKPYLIYNHIVLARAMMSTGDYYEATLLLSNLERQCRIFQRVMDLIEVRVLRSIAEYALHHESAACVHLAEAINDACGYGFIRIFSDDAKALWPILEALGADSGDVFIKKIMISCKKMLSLLGVKPLHKSLTNAGLTKTELKILKALPADMSYEEIAFDNNISINTVKSHIHSIYSKLGARDRTAAVASARKSGIID